MSTKQKINSQIFQDSNDIFYPKDEIEVSDLVKDFYKKNSSIELTGTNSKNFIGNKTQAANKVSLSKLSGIIEYLPEELYIKVKACTPMKEIEEALGKQQGGAAKKMAENPLDEDEVEEGNEFSGERDKAIKAGKDSFEVDGKTYPVKDVDKDDKENAKEFTKESMKLSDMIKKPSVNEGKHDAILDKLADLVGNAKSFMDIGKELKKNGIKYSFGTNMIPMYIIDKPVKIAILNKKYADGAEREVGSTAIGLMEGMSMNEAKYDIGMARKGNGLTVYNKAEEENGDYKNVAHIDNKGKIKYYDKKLPSKIKKEIEAEAKKMMEVKTEGTMKLKNLLKESIGIGELPSSKLMKMKVSAKDMLESVGEDDVNEARVSAKKLLQSVVNGETDRVEGIKMSKEMAQSFLDWQRLSPFGKKYGTLPFNRLFTAAFSWGLHRHADKKSKEYKELEAKANGMFKARRSESVVTEGASTEEKRIVMLAVRKIAKYRNVPINQSVVDVQRAAEELERDIQKGKVKK